MWIIFLFVIVAGNAENVTTEINKTGHNKNTYASMLLDALEGQQWDEREAPCVDTMLRIVGHADNFTLWAVWILDSFTRPVGHLYGQTYHFGNYDECLNPSRGFLLNPEVPKTQYCMVDVTLTGTEGYVKPQNYEVVEHDVTTDVYLKKPTKHGQLLSKMWWGVCVPETCEPSSAAKIARAVLHTSHLGALADSTTVKTTHCVSGGSQKSMEFVYVILFLSATTVFCTYYVNKTKTSTRSFVGELARSFCLNRNMESLTEVRDDEIHSMNLLRVISCIAVVFIHINIVGTVFTRDGKEVELMLDQYVYMFIRSDIIVDTFLALSGVLFTRGILGDKWQSPLKYIWKRYIRLAAALSAILFYNATTSGQVGDGPLWQMGITEQRVCAESWWSNLLMLGNVIHIDKLCNISTWYVPCDFQLCVFATILFFVYRKNRSLGIFAFSISFALSMVIPGAITYINGYSAISFYGLESLEMLYFKRDFIWWAMYVPSYCRAGPFVVGMALGHIMHTHKPKYHRKVVGRLPSYLALISSGLLSFAIFVYGLHYYLVDEPVGAAIYAGVNRTIWGLVVCVFIGVAEYGDVPLLVRASTWSPLAPLSKLTYGVYLTHFPMLLYTYFSTRTTGSTMDEFSMIMTVSGLMIISLGASLALWLLVEAPVININNMLLNKTWKIKTTKSRVNSNGETKVSANFNGLNCNGASKVSAKSNEVNCNEETKVSVKSISVNSNGEMKVSAKSNGMNCNGKIKLL